MSLAPRSAAPASGIAQEPGSCAACNVRHTSLCGTLLPEEILELSAIAQLRSVAAGNTFSFQGDRTTAFANITSGVAKLVRGSEDGRQQIVGLLFASDFLGNVGANSQNEEEPHSIVAVTDIDLCVFPRTGFKRLMATHPSLEAALLKQCLDELQLARDWMVLLGRKTAEERVASFLLHVARKLQGRGCAVSLAFDLPLDRSDIADYIGLTVETVSRQITNLRKAGILELTGARHVSHIDLERLKEKSGF